MKDKILYLILGILIGAIITAGCFLIIGKSTNNNSEENRRPNFEDLDKDMGNRPNFENMEDGEPPELPNDFDESEMNNGKVPGGQRGNRSDKKIDSNVSNSDNTSSENEL